MIGQFGTAAQGQAPRDGQRARRNPDITRRKRRAIGNDDIAASIEE